jgi:predicted phosphoadenosine phosphosulfate sulfurtransferase
VAEEVNANLDAETAALLSMVIALKDIDDNLQKAYEEYMKPTRNMAVIIGLIKNSEFYRNFNSLARTRRITQAEQRGVWEQDREKYKTEQKNVLLLLA